MLCLNILVWKENWKCQLLGHVQLFVTPWTVDWQAPLLMEFSGQEYSSGLPFLFSRDLFDPEVEPVSPEFQADALQVVKQNY